MGSIAEMLAKLFASQTVMPPARSLNQSVDGNKTPNRAMRPPAPPSGGVRG